MKYSEICNSKNKRCGIYKITNLINHHCYIGQTKRCFVERWIEHYYAATNNRGGEKHTPLHQAIIKYGIDNFDFEILECCEVSELDEKEKNWVAFYKANNNKNYNQTSGGNNENLTASLIPHFWEIVEELRNSRLSQIEIAKKYDCTENQVNGINLGKNYWQDSLSYPLRRTSLDSIIPEIINDLRAKRLTFWQIGEKYNISIPTIRRINSGEGKYHQEGIEYPIYVRKVLDENQLNNIIIDLQQTSLSFADLGRKYEVSSGLISKIDKGVLHYKQGYDYPIRK